MRAKFRIMIECNVPEGGVIGFKEALEAHTALANHAKNLRTQLNLLMGVSMDAVATISIDDLPPTYVNIKD